MTRRQSEVLAFIKSFWKDAGYSPSYREIGSALNTSQSNAHDLVRQLEVKGYVSLIGGRHRSIQINESQTMEVKNG
jgi:repressor LexA